MILVAVTLIGVLSVVFTKGRLLRLAALPLRHIWVVWFAIVLQIVIFEVLGGIIPELISQVLHLATYAIALSFLWLNRHVPGALLIGVGAASNLAAITANGGIMPASATAWQRAGLPQVPDHKFENSNTVGSPRLAFLGDIFYVPEGWPLANVFSIGDVIIAIAATYLAHAWCRQSHTSNFWAPPHSEDRVEPALVA